MFVNGIKHEIWKWRAVQISFQPCPLNWPAKKYKALQKPKAALYCRDWSFITDFDFMPKLTTRYSNKPWWKTLATKELSLAQFPKQFLPTPMASKLFSTIFNNKRNFTKTNLEIFTRAYRAAKPVARNNLYSRISPLGDPDVSLTPVLDQWVLEGQKISELELQRIIRQLRSRKRFKHALQVHYFSPK